MVVLGAFEAKSPARLRGPQESPAQTLLFAVKTPPSTPSSARQRKRVERWELESKSLLRGYFAAIRG
jgi:hypothetical protein